MGRPPRRRFDAGSSSDDDDNSTTAGPAARRARAAAAPFVARKARATSLFSCGSREVSELGAEFHAERGDAPEQYFIHATRLDGAGSPVARGFLMTEQDYQTCTDSVIVWPEAVPFHRATPAPA